MLLADSTPGRFRKRPVEVEAIQFTEATRAAVLAWSGLRDIGVRDQLLIETLEGTMEARAGDWIIRGVQGELYPCKPDIFAATYEAVR